MSNTDYINDKGSEVGGKDGTKDSGERVWTWEQIKSIGMVPWDDSRLDISILWLFRYIMALTSWVSFYSHAEHIL